MADIFVRRPLSLFRSSLKCVPPERDFVQECRPFYRDRTSKPSRKTYGGYRRISMTERQKVHGFHTFYPRARASVARSATVCASASPPPLLTPLDGRVTVSAVDHLRRGRGRGRGRISANLAPLTSALRVPRRGFTHPRHHPPPLHLVSAPENLPHVRLTGCSPPKGQEPRGEPSPASNVAPYLMRYQTAG